ncbi:MAG TPA: nucleotidyltransferase [Clostridiales bacterium]|jgi:predicted nucleotidyltransferase|nr:nucleotidyltransferase [Clostridiales bacterium]
MAPYSIEELKSIIIPIARQHGVESVSIFGSYSRGTASAESDLDLKIEKGDLRSLFQLSAFRLAVEDALNLSVDLVTNEVSDANFLDMIAKEEVLLYRSA